MEQQSHQIQTEPEASGRNLISLLYDQLIQADKKNDKVTAEKITYVLEIVLTKKYETKHTFKFHKTRLSIDNQVELSNMPDRVCVILKEVIQKPARITEIQEKVTQLTGCYRSIRETIKYLVKQDKIVSVKYNENNRLTYFGLKEWKDETNNDFKPEYHPTKKQEIDMNIRIAERDYSLV